MTHDRPALLVLDDVLQILSEAFLARSGCCFVPGVLQCTSATASRFGGVDDLFEVVLEQVHVPLVPDRYLIGRPLWSTSADTSIPTAHKQRGL